MNVKDIEQKVAELKFRERDLLKELDRLRGRYLYNAEKSKTVNLVLEKIFVEVLGLNRNSVNKYSQLGNCSGRGNEEFIDDVTVSLYTNKTEQSLYCSDCSEITVKLRINENFSEETIRKKETKIMDEILDIRTEIDRLQLTKKNIKQQNP